MAYTFKHGDRPLDDFTIQRAVGSGGFGEVYYAISDGGREVALKYLRDNPQMELRGVSHTMNLKSPHLVSIFDVRKNTDGEYFIIMEYISGPSLRDVLIAEPHGLGPQKAAFFIREIGKGLAYLHDRGIVHRDLKPGNIFYDDGYVKIGDYGLSKFISVSRHSAQTASIGTVHYMAPEIGSGDYSKSVDIYALGVMLYEMLLGKVPFEGSSMAEVLMKHLTSQPEVDELPEPFGGIIRKALQKDPKDRYQSADEMVEALLEVDSVQQSLAGFSPQSLDGAVHRGSPEIANSPIPSPNPGAAFQNDFQRPQAPPQAFPVPDAPPLPRRVARKMQRINRRMDQRMAKLAGRAGPPVSPGRPAPPHVPPPSGQPQRGATSAAYAPASRGDRFKRMVIALPLSLLLAVGTGFAGAGMFDGYPEAGASAGMFVVAIALSVLASRRIVRWLGPNADALWVRRFVALACSAALIFPAAAPLLSSNTRFCHIGLAAAFGLLGAMLFGRWHRGLDNGATGDFRLGNAISAGFFAFWPTCISGGIIVDRAMPEVAFYAAMIGAVAALVVHALGWWLTPSANAPRDDEPGGGFGGDGQPHQYAEGSPPAPSTPWDVTQTSVPATPAQAQPASMPDHHQTSPLPGSVVDPKLRWGVTRAFFAVLAFVLMGGSIITAIIPIGSRGLNRDEVTCLVVASIASFALMIFALRKTTPVKRIGFWRESVRPFLQSIGLFLIGGSVVGITQYWHCGEEARFASIGGLVFGSLLFSLASIIGCGCRRKPRKPHSFIRPGSSSYAVAPEPSDAAQPADPQA